jgi:hypothetical protein
MNISGVDAIFPNLGHDRHGAPSPEGMELAARMVVRRWPKAMFQTVESTYSALADVPFGTTHDLFIYRDLEALLRWDTSENPNDMIELFRSHDGLTVVVGDDKDPVAAGVLAELDSVRLPGVPPNFA